MKNQLMLFINNQDALVEPVSGACEVDAKSATSFENLSYTESSARMKYPKLRRHKGSQRFAVKGVFGAAFIAAAEQEMLRAAFPHQFRLE